MTGTGPDFVEAKLAERDQRHDSGGVNRPTRNSRRRTLDPIQERGPALAVHLIDQQTFDRQPFPRREVRSQGTHRRLPPSYFGYGGGRLEPRPECRDPRGRGRQSEQGTNRCRAKEIEVEHIRMRLL